MPQKKPHIILIMTDQQRCDTIGAWGCDYMVTPHMDRLAYEGISFRQAYCPGPLREEGGALAEVIARVNRGSDEGQYGSTTAVLHRLFLLSRDHGHGERAIGEAFRMIRVAAPEVLEGLCSEGGACTALGRDVKVQDAFLRAYDTEYA